MPENEQERNGEIADGDFNHPLGAVTRDVARHTARKYGAKRLIEYDLGGSPAIAAGDDGREWSLLVA